MDFPEITYGSTSSMLWANTKIKEAMGLDKQIRKKLIYLSEIIKKVYLELEPYFKNYTEKICQTCKTPCCVNRHGFPDFEDLIVFNAMGIAILEFDCSFCDTDLCQFLTKEGCSRERYSRSYRCTWYFCDRVFDEFELKHKAAFKEFELLMKKLSWYRTSLIKEFEPLWKRELSILSKGK